MTKHLILSLVEPGRYGIMGLGAVCHTLNPRLFAADLEYIVNHGARMCMP